MFSTRKSYNVDTETAQWQRLYRTIEENVRRELMEEVEEQINKLKRKNRKLKDQNQCLMEMVAMMRHIDLLYASDHNEDSFREIVGLTKEES
jgi:DNA-binding transcriptional regulator GbsR (MarR family)